MFDTTFSNSSQQDSLNQQSAEEGPVSSLVNMVVEPTPVSSKAAANGGRGLYLHWEGKKLYRQRVPTPRILEPVPSLSVGDVSDNLLIEGDNLQVLASLKPRYAGQIDVVYIDPPYNTGKDDFRYSDKRFHDPDADDNDAVYVNNEDGGRHTKWLNFMAPRLYLLWEMLNDDRGVIFVSINDIELFRLGMLLNEIFGEENWVGTIVWKQTTDNNPTRIAMEHENHAPQGEIYVLQIHLQLRDSCFILPEQNPFLRE